AQVVNTAIAGKQRFDTMRSFFEGVGTGDKAGVWEDTPVERPEFRAQVQRQTARAQRKAGAEDPIGC
ncbi:MAG: chlorophyllide reductase subunit Y, partial [Gammaproteobacteria bacterium]|nr:chlorophyllide reductase subunit Y [Gammaproteobacteria bacterium]NNL99958.1 chlorophyllide reductase subunit Y [Gammaproteobacteria bacterium]